MREKIVFAKKIFLFFFCIFLNLAGGFLASAYDFPVRLDLVGSVVAVYYLGLVPGCAMGGVYSLACAFQDPQMLVYALAGFVSAALFWTCARWKLFDETTKAEGVSILIGFAAAGITIPLNYYFFGGYSGNRWGDALMDMLRWYGMPYIISSAAGGFLVEVVDKQICVLAGICIIRFFGQLDKIVKIRMGKVEMQGEQPGSRILAILLAVAIGSGFLMEPGLLAEAAGATDITSEPTYVGQIYDNTNGMISAEAKAIEETEDGFIWIGSYAGLTRYDGLSFEFIREGGIAGVTALQTDKGGRLWIGTNDRGVVRYENGSFTFLTQETEEYMGSVRSFAEAGDGSMYVGTTESLYLVDRYDQFTRLDMDTFFVTHMFTEEDTLYGVTNDGTLFAVRNGEFFISAQPTLFNCIARTSSGILAGSSDHGLYQVNLGKSGLQVKKTFLAPVREVSIICEDTQGKIWMCADGGVGYLSTDGKYIRQKVQGFDSSIENMHEDYQGNIWIASSRYGVLKMSASPFTDLFDQADVEPAVANAVVRYDGNIYCGTDSGLVVLSEDGKTIENELTKLLDGIRIRCVTKDSEGNLWLCTYHQSGLICRGTDGSICTYNTENSGVTGNRFRCAIELSDGTMAVGTTNGLNFVKDGAVTGTVTRKDGLENEQILCLMESEDGTLYVGTDGGGIYLVRNGEICGRYTAAEGLSSNAILRMVPYEKGFFVVTGSSLCYVGDQGIRSLSNFPYFNNYDVIVNGKELFVLSSAGIYVVNGQKLLDGSNLLYRLYNVMSGLPTGLTANSWNLMEGDNLYFCGNSGVVLFRKQKEDAEKNYRFGISGLECDGEQVPYSSNRLNIPAGTRRITITPAVHNYLLTDIKARFYVEGVDVRPSLVDYDKLEPLVFTNLVHGEYRLHFQIYDGTGNNILEEKIYTLVKEPQFWENSWFRLYLIGVCVEIIAFLSYAVFQMRNVTKRKQKLEKVRKELEAQLEMQMMEVVHQRIKTEELLHQVVAALSETVDAKDRYTSGHSKRVAKYSRIIAARMGKSEQEQEEIFYAGLLHDVGKIRIPDDIINKTGKLSDDEFNQIKLHPVAGYHILKDISANRKFSEGARFHHERYDGKGYPSGLGGNNIPEIARIIGVADSYDAMASNRSYRKALPQEVVRSEIEKNKGTQFDPVIADIMLQLIDEDKDYNMKEADDRSREILVVDDEPMNLRMVQHLMKEEERYHIVTATTAEQALSLMEQRPIEMILLDIEMPEMDGFELLSKIREKYDTPVAFMTANKDLDTIKKAEEVGVEDYLTKPLLPIALQEVIHSIVK